jgi:hypothetical protein
LSAVRLPTEVKDSELFSDFMWGVSII